ITVTIKLSWRTIKFGLKKLRSRAGNDIIKSKHRAREFIPPKFHFKQKPKSIDFTNGERSYTLGRRDIYSCTRVILKNA
ncbi:14100_t:CDS:2, partial [Funneliformis mosseae]